MCHNLLHLASAALGIILSETRIRKLLALTYVVIAVVEAAYCECTFGWWT